MAKKHDRVFSLPLWKITDGITQNYLQRYLPKERNAVILDAAGGTGRWGIPLAREGCRVIIVDISQGMLDVARKKIEKEGLQDRITLVKGDMSKLDYPNDFFDLIICFTDALPLVEDIQKTLQEFHRVMKTGSHVLADLINRFVYILKPGVLDNLYDTKNAKALLERFKKANYATVKSPGGKEVKWLLHSPKEAKNLFENSGLKVDKIIGKPILLPWKSPLFYRTQDLKPSSKLLKNLLELELKLCEEYTLLGMSVKLMVIAKKMS